MYGVSFILHPAWRHAEVAGACAAVSSLVLPSMQTAASVPLSAMGASNMPSSGSAGSLQKAVAKFSSWRAASGGGSSGRSVGGTSQPGSPPSPSSMRAAFPANATLALRRVRPRAPQTQTQSSARAP